METSFSDDSIKMFQANTNRQDSKRKMIFDGDHGQTSNPKQQVKIVTSFLKKQFNKDAEKIQECTKKKKMKIPFTPLEVTKAIEKLKYNKSTGMDNIRAEHL